VNINLLKRTAAGASLVLAAAGLVLTISTSASAAPISSGTGSTVGTIPLCDWTLKGVGGSIALTNTAYEANKTNTNKYQGVAYPLVGQTTSVEIYVSDPTLTTSQTNTSNCSWYGVVKGGSVTVTTAADPKFTSSRAGFALDNSMGFLLSSSNKLVGLAAIETCTDWTKVTLADVFTGTISSTPIALAAGDTTTISKCTYSVAYSTSIPANQTPFAPGVDYALVGPVMTTTLVITS
jgi:hypothetical protein